MNLDADVVRDQANDALAVRRRQRQTRVADPFAEPIEPEPAIGVQHHFDDGGVVQPRGDRIPKRRAQHPRAA